MLARYLSVDLCKGETLGWCVSNSPTGAYLSCKGGAVVLKVVNQTVDRISWTDLVVEFGNGYEGFIKLHIIRIPRV